MAISVVMPAYNEDSGIAEFIGELHEHLKEWHPTFFVVDDGLETLVLKSKGVWPSKEMGEKVDVTFYLFRVGP